MFLTICSGKHLWSSYGISAGNNSAINLPHTGLTVPSVTFLKQPQNADKLVFMGGLVCQFTQFMHISRVMSVA